MNYRGPAYLDELDTASRWSDRKDSFSLMAQALLAAEAECERLRNCCKVLKKCLVESEKQEAHYVNILDIQRKAYEEYRALYGKLNHVEQEEMK